MCATESAVAFIILLDVVDFGAGAVAIFFQAVFTLVNFDLKFESCATVRAIVNRFHKGFAAFDVFHWQYIKAKDFHVLIIGRSCIALSHIL